VVQHIRLTSHDTARPTYALEVLEELHCSLFGGGSVCKHPKVPLPDWEPRGDEVDAASIVAAEFQRLEKGFRDNCPPRWHSNSGQNGTRPSQRCEGVSITSDCRCRYLVRRG
jgi:hypothetical protein